MKRVDIQKIIQLRKNLNITQEDVAMHLKMTRVTYNFREKLGKFSNDEITDLAKLLHVKPEELYQNVFTSSNRSVPELRHLSLRLQEERRQMMEQMEKLKEDEIKRYTSTILKTKNDLAHYLQQTIKEQSNILSEAEAKYHDRYINLLEMQLKDKQDTINELKERLSQIETLIKYFMEKVEAMFNKSFDYSKIIDTYFHDLKTETLQHNKRNILQKK